MWTLKKAHRIGELFAAVAVVLSLLFVGYEIQQNNQRQAQATTQELVGQYTSLVSMLAENADLRCAYSKGLRDFNGLSGTEGIAFSAYLLTLFRFREDLYFQFLDGEVEPQVWAGFDASVREAMQWPGYQQWFEFRRTWFSESFQGYIDDIRDTPMEVIVPFEDQNCSSGSRG